jgi:hypothetical protein
MNSINNVESNMLSDDLKKYELKEIEVKNTFGGEAPTQHTQKWYSEDTGFVFSVTTDDGGNTWYNMVGQVVTAGRDNNVMY